MPTIIKKTGILIINLTKNHGPKLIDWIAKELINKVTKEGKKYAQKKYTNLKKK